MDTPGKILKAERQRQGKTLQDISVSLKLGTDYLKAMEEDNYTGLPAEVFTRAYLRMYADELGIESAHILDLYNNYCRTEAPEEPIPEEEQHERSLMERIGPVLDFAGESLNGIVSLIMKVSAAFKKFTPSFKPSLKIDFSMIKKFMHPVFDRKIIIAVVVSAVAISLFVLMKYPDKQTSAPHDAPVTGTAEVDEAQAMIEKVVKEPVNAIKDEPVQKKVGKKVSERLVLKIIADELTWVSVSIDDGEYRESMLRPGKEVIVSAENKFNLRIGNAGGTRLVLNGKELERPGPRGKVVNIEIP